MLQNDAGAKEATFEIALGNAMSDSTRVQEWLRWVLVTSVPLRRLDVMDIPVGIASACLIDPVLGWQPWEFTNDRA